MGSLGSEVKKSWPPRMLRLPLEAGPPVDTCQWHETVAATCRVRTFAGKRGVWSPVCDDCADQIESELADPMFCEL